MSSYLDRLFVEALCPVIRSDPFFQLRLPDGRSVSFSKNLILGRKPSTGIDEDTLRLEDISISREHALMQIGKRNIVISDLLSRNRTYVGNEPVSQPRVLIPGDIVTLAGQLTYQKRAWKIEGGYPITFLGSYF